MDTVHLIGAEDVRAAGNRVAAAADDMRQAAANFDGSIERAGGMLQGAVDQLTRAAELMVKAQIAAAQIAGMTAENEYRQATRGGVAYRGEAFFQIAERLRAEVAP